MKEFQSPHLKIDFKNIEKNFPKKMLTTHYSYNIKYLE